jgi:hypothetical protein
MNLINLAYIDVSLDVTLPPLSEISKQFHPLLKEVHFVPDEEDSKSQETPLIFTISAQCSTLK